MFWHGGTFHWAGYMVVCKALVLYQTTQSTGIGRCGGYVKVRVLVQPHGGPPEGRHKTIYRNLDWYGRVFPVLTHSTGALPTQG